MSETFVADYTGGQGRGPCGGCNHDPACGFAEITNDFTDTTTWYCHADSHSCFVEAVTL